MSSGRQRTDNRQHQRHGVCFAASVNLGERIVGGEVRDISAGGAKVEVGQAVTLNSMITLSIDRFGDFKGQVTWSENTTIGLNFSEDPVAMAEVAYAMALYGPI